MEKVLEKQINKKNSISCKECCRQMGDYIDGKLDVNDDIVFVAHIRQCRQCAEEFHNYYNFMTNLYFLNYGYNDRFPSSEEVLMKETEDIELKYRKKHKLMGVSISLLLILIIILVSFIIIRHVGGYAL